LTSGTGQPNLWLKLKNLQPTNAYKIRSAANAVALLSDSDRAHGVGR
jgi:threonine dehydratase